MTEYLLVTEGQPREGESLLVIKDLTDGKYKYKMIKVKAELLRSKNDSPEWDTLWIMNKRGHVDSTPWCIRIIERLPLER